jgi:hypothetical protein
VVEQNEKPEKKQKLKLPEFFKFDSNLLSLQRGARAKKLQRARIHPENPSISCTHQYILERLAKWI